MTSKLPWATAAVIIVVAAIGAWTIFGGAPPTGTAGVSATLGAGTVFAQYPTDSGIEAIYIMQHAAVAYTENMADSPGNVLGTISASEGFVEIAYDTPFDICVAVSGKDVDMGQLTLAYLMVALGATTDSTDWSITYENSDDNADVGEYIFFSDATWIRANVVWDNAGTGYELKADDNLNMTAVDLWLRGPVS